MPVQNQNLFPTPKTSPSIGVKKMEPKKWVVLEINKYANAKNQNSNRKALREDSQCANSRSNKNESHQKMSAGTLPRQQKFLLAKFFSKDSRRIFKKSSKLPVAWKVVAKPFHGRKYFECMLVAKISKSTNLIDFVSYFRKIQDESMQSQKQKKKKEMEIMTQEN